MGHFCAFPRRPLRHVRALPSNQRPFRLNLHARYDLALAERDHGARIAAKPDARVITDGRPGIA
jgi:hypothetical protein